MKKILIISESIDIEDSSASKVNIALIQNLKKIGYQIKVLHYTRKNIQLANDIECIAIPEIKFSLMYLLSRTQRVLQRTFKVNWSKKLEKIFGHSFTFFNDTKSISKAVKKEFANQDLVITLSKGASFRPHYALLSLPNLHAKWMAYVHDPYPFHFYPRPYDWVEAGYQFKEDFFRKVSEKAAYSAFPSKMLLEWMGSYLPNFLKTGMVIPHQINKSVMGLSNQNSQKSDKFVLLHAGNLMNTRPVVGLLQGLQQFLEKNTTAVPNVELHLLGDNQYYQTQIQDFQKLYPLVCKEFGKVSYQEANQLQNNATVSLIIESNVATSPFLPGKFPNCVAINKPILLLSPYYSECKRLLGNNYPYWAEVMDGDGIAKAIEQLYIDWTNQPNFTLHRPDLETYLGETYLQEQLLKIW